MICPCHKVLGICTSSLHNQVFFSTMHYPNHFRTEMEESENSFLQLINSYLRAILTFIIAIATQSITVRFAVLRPTLLRINLNKIHVRFCSSFPSLGAMYWSFLYNSPSPLLYQGQSAKPYAHTTTLVVYIFPKHATRTAKIQNLAFWCTRPSKFSIWLWKIRTFGQNVMLLRFALFHFQTWWAAVSDLNF